MIGEVIKGRYQILEILSRGGFCQTYLAQDLFEPDSAKCVIKHLSTATSPQPQTIADLRSSFTREAQALEKLGEHDQVPQLLAHFEIDREFYLVQQFVTGHPLSEELQTPWQESQVVELLQQVLGILEYVHDYGLIHRDIKPSNLIRRSDRQLVLIDFGSVKQVWKQVVTAGGQTSSKFVEGIPATVAIGTPGYMPTEQGRGRPRPNSDIYALGMIGIQALTGRSPSELLEDADGEIIWQHYADVSPRLANILNQMVRYHFKERYQSATEALQALQPLTQNDNLNLVQLTSDAVEKRSPTFTTDTSNTTNSKSDQLTLWLGLAIGAVSAVVLIVSSYYYLRPLPPNNSPSSWQETIHDLAQSTFNLSKDVVK
ncbi:serine/threonine protein kinase [Gloeocapsopsis crepidinum LEGE 06123]|uniref:non-specific serine/threonine protein kinase n=1 Tax=Gloeocapsopsis crepidinum LEGE 06123 TaxID=588587 RepID=A0ABR9UU63_9CHRO|nr:serine/threonine-protein kinase [Gloeocapsopsis crepidinum]MBE9191827.1 serine/threonine protein kinase [Gloeocapsopsis crepidinum LEGE 06123]